MPRRKDTSEKIVQPGSPAARAAELSRQRDKVTRRYKVNVSKRRKFSFEGEAELVYDMVVVLKLANYTNKQIAMIVGISIGQVKEILNDGNVQKKYLALKAKLPQAALELGRAYLIEAVQAVANIMRTADDPAVVLKAAAELFDRFGIPKVSRQVTDLNSESPEDHPVGDDLMAKLRQASPEVQTAAAELQDMFEEGLKQLLEGGKREAPSPE